MTTFLKKLSFSFLFMFAASVAFAQEQAANQSPTSANNVYLGLGIGLDYGGVGAKIEYLPVDNVGVFAGLGYNLIDVGWNVGATYKIKTGDNMSFNPMVFYGYNGAIKVEGAPEYDMTSYGVTLGVNLDFYVGKSGNKISAGLFVPIRSQKFMDNYDEAKNSPYINFDSNLLPIAIGVGYNWKLN